MNITTIACGSAFANCYIIEDDNKAVIIDPGYPEEELMQYVNENSKKVKYILLTHRHFDHVNAAVKVRDITGAKIVIHSLDECGLYSDDASLSAMSGFYYGKADPDARADILVKQDDIITIGRLLFKIIETPGHSPGGVCYLCESENILFSGDTLFKGTVGRTDLPFCDYTELIKSVKLLSLLPEDTVVYPGHGPTTTIGQEKIYNSFMRY